MKKKIFEKVDESLYTEKLDNDIEVYLYKTDKTKNFYISISVKYGANVTKYKKDNKIKNIVPGTAHFLEHKVMALSENASISKRINDLGSLANAWTSYYGTNYNIFGSVNIKENISLLLDIFYNIDINEESVEGEKGIISEEIDMYKDRIDSFMYSSLYNNLFEKCYAKNTVLGSKDDIAKITYKSLNDVYNDFYLPNNTFIIVCGNFDEVDIMDYIKYYYKNFKLQSKSIPKRIKEKESSKVLVPYQEIKKDVDSSRVKYAFKINKKIFGIKSDFILKNYIIGILSNNFSATSKLYEKYKNNNIIVNMDYSCSIIDDYIIIIISSITNNSQLFIDSVKKDIKNMNLTKEEFERKKKRYLKGYILTFDNIEDIEYFIAISLMVENKVELNDYSKISNMTYSETKRIMKLLSFENESIIKTVK